MRIQVRLSDSVSSNSIPVEEIKRLHKMGFILVPLTDDGRTPNVYGLLTEDEKERSKQESEDGEEHPINYISNHPEFWNERRIESEMMRFKNVATVLGRTHLREPDGQPLYLNALDIDSEQVFTILCRLCGPDGQDVYFIDEMCKNTFVSKTKKKYGRHIFWLSREQYNPVGTRHCKHGSEFEIKTDNSLGLITLPPSRHRDDSNIRYHSMGQDGIKIIDKMYSELLTILDDCLKPANDKSTTGDKHSGHKEKNVRDQDSISQDTEYVEYIIQTIANRLEPFYRKGHRYSIITGFAGLSYKRSMLKEYAGKVVEILTSKDEERTNRFRILEVTYNKESKLVSGYNYFLSVLENASGEYRIAVDILRGILALIDELTHQNGEIDRVTSLTENMMKEFEFRTMSDTKELYYYDSDHGIYIPAGECLVEAQLELLYPEISTHKVQEVTQKIKRRTLTHRDEFDSNEEIVNVKNGLLNIHTGEIKDHSPSFLSTIQLPIHYNPSIKCHNILRFLGQVLHPQDVFTAMQIFGYVLLKDSKFEKAFMLFGSGDNGKSVFIKLIESFVGRQNTSHVTLQDLDSDRFSSADLYGKLVNVFADLKATKLSSTGNFKTLVSGDSVRAQHKYGQPFSFRSHAKLVFSANRIPDSEDTSHAYYKRWLILHFEKSFTEGDKDTGLIDKLTTDDELSSLLNLALVGLKQLEKDGGFRDIPVEDVKRDYERKSNTVKAFLQDKCSIDLQAPDYITPSAKVYDEYQEYCRQRRERPLDVNVLGTKLKETGIERERLRTRGTREYYYCGIKLLSDLRGQNQSLL
jgi:P4 family phage/plasmid primase-like protien